MAIYMVMNRNSGKTSSRQETHVSAYGSHPSYYKDKEQAQRDADYWNQANTDEKWEVVELIDR
jgi:hypothetical protein